MSDDRWEEKQRVEANHSHPLPKIAPSLSILFSPVFVYIHFLLLSLPAVSQDACVCVCELAKERESKCVCVCVCVCECVCAFKDPFSSTRSLTASLGNLGSGGINYVRSRNVVWKSMKNLPLCYFLISKSRKKWKWLNIVSALSKK